MTLDKMQLDTVRTHVAGYPQCDRCDIRSVIAYEKPLVIGKYTYTHHFNVFYCEHYCCSFLIMSDNKLVLGAD
jgi:hypothetical protein